MKNIECDNCHGYRLKPEILQFKINGIHIGELSALTADDALNLFSDSFAISFESEAGKQAAASFQENIFGHLDALKKAGLGYISTDRTVGTLSGGEYQRLQIAGLVRAPLRGVTYILDEPSFGLHPKDTMKISDLILNLNKRGNSIIMVDHSPLLLSKSDYTIELGPSAGSKGGMIMYAGSTKNYHSVELPTERHNIKTSSPGKGLSIKNAHANNLKNIDVYIPSDIMTVITGVSGSGKTSLLDKVIFGSWNSKKPVFCESFEGIENFEDLIYIEQPIPGKGYNATIGAKLGISEVIARIFADTQESKMHGFKHSHFLTGSRESRCPECEGTGINQVSMDFFNDVISPCERCGGTGFRDEVMKIKIAGKTIFDALQIPFNETPGFFDGHLNSKTERQVKQTLELIEKTGIGHLSSSRSLKTLSTGELQRLKLVSGLSKKTGDKTLILLDEPTGGLQQQDIENLMKLFNELIEKGNTIICVTHEQTLIDAGSKTIELGPGGGTMGGEVVR